MHNSIVVHRYTLNGIVLYLYCVKLLVWEYSVKRHYYTLVEIYSREKRLTDIFESMHLYNQRIFRKVSWYSFVLMHVLYKCNKDN
jgi:hypothetical protein